MNAQMTHNPWLVGQLSWTIIKTLLEAGNTTQPPFQIEMGSGTRAKLEASAKIVAAVLAEDRQVYGVNTGFGLLANTRISKKDLNVLQHKLVLSHATGVGQPLAVVIARLVMLLKINSLGQGYSGVRVEVVEQLVRCYNAGLVPWIPEKGSVGASGDLAPLAHMSLMLIGEGKVFFEGRLESAQKALEKLGIQPLQLGPKEGLALLNGTQVSTALALTGLWQAERLLHFGILMGALSVEAGKGSRVPFTESIHRVRNQNAQIQVAAVYRSLLAESDIQKSHVGCAKVQDPYSLRCQPQVMGACWQQIQNAAHILLAEAEGVSDNPLVLPDTQEIVSGGNFHAEPVAMAADNLAIAIAEIGALSERRIALLMDHHLSELPPFLVKEGGLNSGFMIAQVTAAALASENKQLATPSSVDSLPTSANQEDHVSMATYGARRLLTMAENVSHILAIEWLAAAQGCDFHLPLKPSEPLAVAINELRERVPFYEQDRYFQPDIQAAYELLQQGNVLERLKDCFSVLNFANP